MPKYFYVAKSLNGKEKSGVMSVKNERELAKTLKGNGFILIKAKIEINNKKRSFEFDIPIFSGVSLGEKMFFVRNLKVMISAGLPLPRALQTLSTQVKNRKFKKALLGIMNEIVKGKNFGDSLANYPSIFSELFRNMIKVGEESGTLDKVLGILSLQLEREYELKSKIKGALMYPIVILIAMFGIGALMLITVVPKLAETFNELGVELPIMTKIIISIGNFLAENWYLGIFLIIPLFFIFRRILKLKSTKKILDKLFLKFPIISPIVKKTNSAYTARTLSSLIASGVPIVRGLEVTASTLGNIYFKNAILDACEKVKKGEKLSKALKPYKNIYPQIMFQMIAVGEETGETAEILAKLAEFFEAEVTNTTKNLASIIEPILMLIIGVVIGFFAISMIQPMYSMLGDV